MLGYDFPLVFVEDVDERELLSLLIVFLGCGVEGYDELEREVGKAQRVTRRAKD